jgi:hypothetical protein
MARKKTHTREKKGSCKSRQKNHENHKIKKKKKTWVLFLLLNVTLKHHSLAFHILSTPQLECSIDVYSGALTMG